MSTIYQTSTGSEFRQTVVDHIQHSVLLPRQSIETLYSVRGADNLDVLVWEGIWRQLNKIVTSDGTTIGLISKTSVSPSMTAHNCIRVHSNVVYSHQINREMFYGEYYPVMNVLRHTRERILTTIKLDENLVSGSGFSPTDVPNSELIRRMGQNDNNTVYLTNPLYPTVVDGRKELIYYDRYGDSEGRMTITNKNNVVIGAVPEIDGYVPRPSGLRVDYSVLFDPHDADHNEWFSKYGKVSETKTFMGITLNNPIYTIKCNPEYIEQVKLRGGQVLTDEDDNVIMIVYAGWKYVPYTFYYGIVPDHDKFINCIVDIVLALDRNVESNNPWDSDSKIVDREVLNDMVMRLFREKIRKIERDVIRYTNQYASVVRDMTVARTGVQYHSNTVEFLRKCIDVEKISRDMDRIKDIPGVVDVDATFYHIGIIVDGVEVKVKRNNEIIGTVNTRPFAIQINDDGEVYVCSDMKLDQGLGIHPHVTKKKSAGRWCVVIPPDLANSYIEAWSRKDLHNVVRIILHHLSNYDVQPYNMDIIQRYLDAQQDG